jgi:ABC-type nitrate/sulfonate/bicarbonate transport system permease component
MTLGFLSGVGLGVPLGLLMGWNKTVGTMISPFFDIFRQIPPLAWIPYSVLLFGIGASSKIFLIFVASIVPAILNTRRGIMLVDPEYVEAAKVMGANGLQIMMKVVLPASSPSIFAGIQHSLSLSWMSIIAAEFVAGNRGLGFLMVYGMEIPDLAMVTLGMLIVGFIGFIMTQALKYLENKMLRWK